MGDLNGDGVVAGDDLAIMLAGWGPCPVLLGGCCNMDGAGGCVVLTQSDCDLAGGNFLGGGSVCEDCPPISCGPGAGGCCAGNGTPGCDEVNCCAAVCATDSFCCQVEWDFICAEEAAAMCGSLCLPPPANDSCSDALGIGDGNTAFDTTAATTDGLQHAGCEFDGQTYNDIWYDYTATCTGTLVISTCGQANYDTDLVAYNGCTCPAITANLLACDDDTASCGLTSQIQFAVISAACYKVRVGGFGVFDSGTGTLSITCEPAP